MAATGKQVISEAAIANIRIKATIDYVFLIFLFSFLHLHIVLLQCLNKLHALLFPHV